MSDKKVNFEIVNSKNIEKFTKKDNSVIGKFNEETLKESQKQLNEAKEALEKLTGKTDPEKNE